MVKTIKKVTKTVKTKVDRKVVAKVKAAAKTKTVKKTPVTKKHTKAEEKIIIPKLPVLKDEPVEKRTYTVEVQALLPLLRNLPQSYRVRAARKVIDGKEIIFYEIIVIGNQELAAHAEVKRIDKMLYLDKLYVEPAHRNLGLASYLIDMVMLNHQSSDIAVVPEPSEDRNVSRSTLERFFSKFGFSVADKKGTMVRKATKFVDFEVNEENVM